ncbi:hypothetical protein AVEN_181571-1 [Araneus ventricosus]|uniref:Uncharacterized protein n=1 Tax=Araneus ventricosus TaxID=182803 RepID=A0A4Y2E6P2_ARAVE|nr:hypothetical protein AVEN_181571-1 [Araneus ventricosus]
MDAKFFQPRCSKFSRRPWKLNTLSGQTGRSPAPWGNGDLFSHDYRYFHDYHIIRTCSAVTELFPNHIFDCPAILRAWQAVCSSPKEELYSDKIVQIAKAVLYTHGFI